MEKWIDCIEQYRGRIVTLLIGKARLDDGSIAEREVVRHAGGVAVVPVLDDSVLLVRQFRIAIGDEILELPAGRIEAGEDPEACAIRELEEETGYVATQTVHVASYYSSAGFTDERMHVFLAFQLHKTRPKLEREERIEVTEVPIRELEAKLSRREFQDSKTIIGLRELLVHIQQHEG